MARKNKINTRLEIIQVATKFFLEQGYTDTLVPRIAEEIGISKGNLTFHFPTKEHLLAELIKYLCDFQWQVMEQEVTEGNSRLIAYLFELTTMAGSCDENPIAKDLYVAAYIHPMSLRIIRENDTRKTKEIFAEYCPTWSERDFVCAENIVSGIEYAMFVTENTGGISLDENVAGCLDAIMKLYDVPKEVRERSIHNVLEMDYRRIGKRILQEFSEYVESVNKKALEEAFLQGKK